MIQTKYSVIVTENLNDFPEDVLQLYDIVAIGLDDFIADILDMAVNEHLKVTHLHQRIRPTDERLLTSKFVSWPYVAQS